MLVLCYLLSWKIRFVGVLADCMLQFVSSKLPRPYIHISHPWFEVKHIELLILIPIIMFPFLLYSIALVTSVIAVPLTPQLPPRLHGIERIVVTW
jgi:hypothetical protein